MSNKKISYTTRDFQSIRTELINFVRTYYPDLIENVNEDALLNQYTYIDNSLMI